MKMCKGFIDYSQNYQLADQEVVFIATINRVIKSNGHLVMGAGNAKAQAQAVPQLSKWWAEAITENPNDLYHEILLNQKQVYGALITKDHYKDASCPVAVAQALAMLEVEAEQHPETLYLLPAPGMGHGGLDWEDVREACEQLPDNVHIYFGHKFPAPLYESTATMIQEAEDKLDVVIAGGRDFNDMNQLKDTIQALQNSGDLPQEFNVISGLARGADELGLTYARNHGLMMKRYPAQWNDLNVPNCKIKTNKYGSRYNVLAGFNRNQQMAEDSDVAVIFWDGRSSGTRHMINTCRKQGIPVHICNY